MSLPSHQRQEDRLVEQALLELHTQSGAATVAQAWTTGQTLPLDQAVAMALQAEVT